MNPYITASDPNLATTTETLKVLDSYESDIIKLGTTHSDPLVDGPAIHVYSCLLCLLNLMCGLLLMMSFFLCCSYMFFGKMDQS